MYEKKNNKSDPISNNLKKETNYNQYSINNIRFDPTQNSPPSLWKVRLNKRIGENQLKHDYKNK